MRANFALRPFQDNIGRRHREHLAGVGVEGILARQQRRVPDTTAALADHLAVLVLLT